MKNLKLQLENLTAKFKAFQKTHRANLKSSESAKIQIIKLKKVRKELRKKAKLLKYWLNSWIKTLKSIISHEDYLKALKDGRNRQDIFKRFLKEKQDLNQQIKRQSDAIDKYKNSLSKINDKIENLNKQIIK
jgi:hypothetical protein